MAAGDLTASTPTHCGTPAEVKTAVDALNLTAATDFIQVIPDPRKGGWIVFKVLRAA